MKRLLALAFLLAAVPALAQQPAFRTVQSSQDPTGPLGLLTNLGGGQEIDLINGPTTASVSFNFYQQTTNNVRNLIFSISPTQAILSYLAGGGTQCLQVSNTGAITGAGSLCAAPAITQLTGDVTAGPGSGSQAATLATVNSNVGSFGSATSCVAITVNVKGLITAASAATCTPAIGSITGLGTSVATTLGNAINSANGMIVADGGGHLAAAQEVAHTGDCTNSAGAVALTCTKTNGTNFGPLATTTPGTGVAAALGNATNATSGFPTTSGLGTWTPAITALTTAGTPAYSVQQGSYEQIGHTVIAWVDVQLSSWSGSPAGNIAINNLPFTSTATANDYGGCFFAQIGNTTTSYGLITGRIGQSSTQILLFGISSAGTTGGSTQITFGNITGTFSVIGYCIYHT